jgi:hypothetical protein
LKRHPEKKAALLKCRKPRLVNVPVNVNFDPKLGAPEIQLQTGTSPIKLDFGPRSSSEDSKIGEMKRIVVRERPEGEVPEKPDHEMNLNGTRERLGLSRKQLFRRRLSDNVQLVRIGLRITVEMLRKQWPMSIQKSVRA